MNKLRYTFRLVLLSTSTHVSIVVLAISSSSSLVIKRDPNEVFYCGSLLSEHLNWEGMEVRWWTKELKAAVLWKGRAEKESFNTSFLLVDTDDVPSAFNGDGHVENIDTLISHFESEFSSRVKEIKEQQEDLKGGTRSVPETQYIVNIPVPVEGLKENGVPRSKDFLLKPFWKDLCL